MKGREEMRVKRGDIAFVVVVDGVGRNLFGEESSSSERGFVSA